MAYKILVVDDEPDFEELIKAKFRSKIKNKEFEFVFAKNGSQALSKLKEHPDLHIVMTDINMPGIDGLALLNELPKLDRLYKAIVITAYGDMSNIRTAMNRGASEFITKPIDFNDLEHTLEKISYQFSNMEEGASIKNKRREDQQEQEVSLTLQQSMLPHNYIPFPDNHEFELLGMMLPAVQVGGDFFDFFSIDQERLGIVLADVSGKNIPSSLFMAMTRKILRSLTHKYKDTKNTIQQLNEILFIENPDNMIVSMFYGIYNIKTKELIYTNAGHVSPYIIHKNKSLTKLANYQNPALGFYEMIPENNREYDQLKITLSPQDTLFLYSDGVTNAINEHDQLFSDQNLAELLKNNSDKSLADLMNLVVYEVKKFSAPADLLDDISLLCLKVL
jgi:sigma-B regulation protein RsbU (phosphoserine phosphatase)